MALSASEGHRSPEGWLLNGVNYEPDKAKVQWVMRFKTPIVLTGC